MCLVFLLNKLLSQLYIPMPLKNVAHFSTEGSMKVSKGTGLDSFDHSDQHITIAVQTNIPKSLQ